MKLLILWLHPIGGVAGGAQHAIIGLAGAMADRGHEVVLAECADEARPLFFPMAAAVRRVNLADAIPDRPVGALHLTRGQKRWREAVRLLSPRRAWLINEKHRIAPALGALRRLLERERPDVVVAGDPESGSAVRCTVGGAYPLVVMNHVSARTVWAHLTPLDGKTLREAAAVQWLVPEARDFFRSRLPGGRYVCIPNAVAPMAAATGPRARLILSVGRLSRKRKRQHLLIDAFACLAGDFPDWRLAIWGEEAGGDEYTMELKTLIAARGLSERTFLCGTARSLAAEYSRAAIFAQASPDEGFGLALAEAMSAGLPAVACRSAEGARALLRDGETGFLTGDTAEDIAAGLRRLMADEALRRRMGDAARISIKRYEPKGVWDAWERLLAAASEET